MPLTDPVPSSSFDVLERNVQDTDKFVNQETGTFTNRVGKQVKPIPVIEAEANAAVISLGWNQVGLFADGFTYLLQNDIAKDVAGDWYRWNGALPKVVNAGTLPSSDANFVKIDYKSHAELSDRNPADGSAHNADDVAKDGGGSVQDFIDITENAVFFKYQKAAYAANLMVDANTVGHATFGNKFNIGCFGDSTMWGSIPFNTTASDPENPAVSMFKALQLIFPNSYPTHVYNKAIGGTTLKQMLNGTDSQPNGTFEQRVIDNPNMLVIYCNHCLNDCNSYESNLGEYKFNLTEFVRISRKYNRIPVIVTPSLISPIEDGQEFMMKRMPSFIQAQKDVAQALDVDFVDNFYYSTRSAKYYKPQDIAPDGVHLSQLFYQMAGRNMCIPLINPIAISKNGDRKGLSTNIYSDTITTGRGIFKKFGRFSSILSGDKSSVDQNIYIPVLIDDPTDDNVIAMGGYQSEVGATAKFTYFGLTDSPQFGGNVDFSSSVADNNFDSLFVAPRMALPAGLNILGVVCNSSYSGTLANFNCAGFQRIARRESGYGYPYLSGFQYSQPITSGMTVSASLHLVKENDQTLISLNSVVDLSAKIEVKVVGEQVVVVAGGATTVLWDVPQNVPVSLSIYIDYDKTVLVKLGGLSITTAAQSKAFPNMFVATGLMYNVLKN